jgi:2-oxoglutarate ferredoxin oxidoreductase subunit delta
MPQIYVDESKGKRLFLQFNRCGGCGYCIEVCPKNTLEKSSTINERLLNPPTVRSGAECSLCRLCEYICPDFSIYVVDIDKAKEVKEEKKEGEWHL